MIDVLKQAIEKIHVDGDTEYFINGCRKRLAFMDDLAEAVKSDCESMQISNVKCSPADTIRFHVFDFSKEAFNVSYFSTLRINKICDVYYLQHEFRVENADADRITPTLEDFSVEAYTKRQFQLDEHIVSFMEKLRYTRLGYSELMEVVPGAKMPERSAFGPQMTVENALFRDVWALLPVESQ